MEVSAPNCTEGQQALVNFFLTTARQPHTFPGVEASGSASEHGLDDLDPATTPACDAASFRGVVAARAAVDDADRQLREAVAAARAAGDSWTVIGAALDITRQAAQQRFGRP